MEYYLGFGLYAVGDRCGGPVESYCTSLRYVGGGKPAVRYVGGNAG